MLKQRQVELAARIRRDGWVRVLGDLAAIVRYNTDSVRNGSFGELAAKQLELIGQELMRKGIAVCYEEGDLHLEALEGK